MVGSLKQHSNGSTIRVLFERGETVMAVKDKKRVQVQIDKSLAEDTEAVLNELGLTPTTAINMLYKQIVANGALPFKPSLNETERAKLRFLKATEGTPIVEFKDANEVADWLNDPNED